MEVKTYRSDGSELIKEVPELLAQAVGYFALTGAHPTLDIKAQRPDIQMRPYQIDALESIGTRRQSGDRRTLLHLATGLGKTTVAAMDAHAFMLERAQGYDTPPRFLWLAHRRHLVQQAHARFRELFPTVTTTEIIGNRKKRETSQFTFATLQTMENIKEEYRPNEFSYIVVDESHHGPAETFGSTIRHFAPDFLLGVTATPFRSDEKELQAMFGETAYSMSLARGIVEGWLTQLDYRLQMDKVIRRLIASEFRLPHLERALTSPERNKEIARIVLATQTEIPNPRTLVFCTTKKHAEAMSRLLPDSKTMHYDLSEALQDQRWKDFRSGALRTLIAVDMANEGMDIPAINLVIFLRSTDTRLVFEQQLGRGMRRADGKEKLVALDFVGSSERLFMLHRIIEDIKAEYYRTRYKYGSSSKDKEALEIEAEQFVQSLGLSFKSVPVDIIKRFEDLIKAPAPPKGWRTIGAIASSLEISYLEAKGIIKDLRLEGSIMRRAHAKSPSLYFSPDQQSYIAIAVHYNRQLEAWHTHRDLAEAVSMPIPWVRQALKGMGIESRPLRIGSDDLLVSPIDAHTFLESKPVPEDMPMCVPQIVRTTKVPRHLVVKAIEELKLTAMFVEKMGKKDVPYYKAEDVQHIEKYASPVLEERKKIKPKPDGYIPIKSARSQVPGLDGLLKGYGIKPKTYLTGNNRFVECLSPDQWALVRGECSPPPPGSFSHGQAAIALGIDPRTLKRLADKYQIESNNFAETPGKEPTPHISASDFATIADDPYFIAPPAPKEHKTKAEIVREHNISHAFLNHALGELGIESEFFRTSGNKRLEHFSPKDIARVVEHHKNRKQRKG